MTRLRDGCYVWVTWLSKLMAGDVQCLWGTWFKSYYTAYTKAPSDFQLAPWTVEHNKCLNELCSECTPDAASLFKEAQNKFTVKRKMMKIEGKPDLIVLDKNGDFTVYDVKTGQPRTSDIIQVMLYMALLPYSTTGIYKGRRINGLVVYKNDRTPISFSAIDPTFHSQMKHFLDLIDTQVAPKTMPSFAECKYCEITKEDCPDRIEIDAAIDPSVPDFPV